MHACTLFRGFGFNCQICRWSLWMRNLCAEANFKRAQNGMYLPVGTSKVRVDRNAETFYLNCYFIRKIAWPSSLARLSCLLSIDKRLWLPKVGVFPYNLAVESVNTRYKPTLAELIYLVYAPTWILHFLVASNMLLKHGMTDGICCLKVRTNDKPKTVGQTCFSKQRFVKLACQLFHKAVLGTASHSERSSTPFGKPCGRLVYPTGLP